MKKLSCRRALLEHEGLRPDLRYFITLSITGSLNWVAFMSIDLNCDATYFFESLMSTSAKVESCENEESQLLSP